MSQPQVIDLLIVGGGPAGIAAALRARELGLVALIIEVDDVMRRIRDYSKDKLILPSFGGGDQMAFPQAGEWIGRLPFDPIDKDDMVASWKTICQEAGVPVRTGVEMTGIDAHEGEDPEAPMVVRVFDHRQQREGVYSVHHVALALGRGVPRRFDIPGETDTIRLRLEDPAHHVGAPACVIGGGTSAAEAVIAISNAKAASGDTTPVIWSYRGDRLPRVSKALASTFFEAYAGNGNIRYKPSSEPMMVVPGPEREPHLAIRIDRRVIPGRPVETTLFELPTRSCIACIGEDLPETFLASLGIPMVVGGARGRKRMVVTRLLESRRSRVYLIGDILSQAYLETDDFDGDPASFKEVRHRGNIKSALHDGVRVAEVVKQRLSGVADADIALPELEEMSTPSTPLAAATASVSGAGSAPGGPEEGAEATIGMSGPAVAAAAAAATKAASAADGAWLVHLLPGGVDGEEHALDRARTVKLGRRGCDLSYPDDALLAETHASVTFDGEGAVLRDEGAENGVFLQVSSLGKLELRPGDLLRAGRQFLLVQVDESGFALTHYRADGSAAGQHRFSEGTRVLGRRADVTLDPGDGALSRRHLAITVEGERLLVKDLLSANGTYVRVVDQRRLSHGDRFLIGQQRFAFSTRRDAIFDPPRPTSTSGRFSGAIVSAAAAAAGYGAAVDGPGAESAAAAASGPSVTFQPSGKVCPASPDQTILDVAESHGVKISAECRSGICGSDPIRVVSGQENLRPEASRDEAETLEDLCGLEAGPCRLACMARIAGPVVVEILS